MLCFDGVNDIEQPITSCIPSYRRPQDKVVLDATR